MEQSKIIDTLETYQNPKHFFEQKRVSLRFLLNKPPRNQHDQLNPKHGQLNRIMAMPWQI